MQSLWDQLYEAEALLARAEQDGNTTGADILRQRIAHIETHLHSTGP